MKETIYIRLPASAEPVEWAVQDTAAAAPLSQSSRGDMAAAIRAAAGRRIVLIAPATDVLLTSLDLPIRNLKKVAAAAPYALEDQLADDVENLHFALGARQDDGRIPVAVVAVQQMNRWLTPFSDEGLVPEMMLHEGLTLPMDAASDRRWTVLVDGEDALVRPNAWTAFSCGLSELETYLALADFPDDGELIVISATPTAVDALASSVRCPVIRGPEIQHRIEALLLNPASMSALNLLQQSYRPSRAMDAWWHHWRLPLTLAAACVVLALLVQILEYRRLSDDVRELEARALSEFKQAFPDVASPIYLRQQAEQELARLRNGGGDAGLFFLLQETATALSGVGGASIDGLQYRDAQLYLSLVTRDLQALETLRNRFDSRGTVSAEVQSANASSDGVQVRMRIAAGGSA